jgi:hypothetical protein
MRSRTLKKIITSHWAHLIFLCLLLILLFSQSQFKPMDDSFYYLDFARLLSSGKVDFSIAGFHGADIFTAVVYLFSSSQFSVILVDIIFALLNVFMIYLAVSVLYKNKLAGLMAAYIYVLAPFEYTNALRGGHQTPFIFFTLLGIYLLFKDSKYAFLSFGFSYIIKPFSIALAPLFWYKKKYGQFFLSLIIPVVYVIAEYLQIGRIIIGAHQNLTPGVLFSPAKFLINLGYAAQNYLSIHNFSFINNLSLDDMVHLSPLITFLAIMAVIYPAKFFKEKRFFIALVASAALAILIPASFNHLDMWYLWTFNFSLILLAIPVIFKMAKLIPIVVLSFSFQFLYAYLAFENTYWQAGNYTLFLVYSTILAISIIFSLQFYLPKKDKTSPSS